MFSVDDGILEFAFLLRKLRQIMEVELWYIDPIYYGVDKPLLLILSPYGQALIWWIKIDQVALLK